MVCCDTFWNLSKQSKWTQSQCVIKIFINHFWPDESFLPLLLQIQFLLFYFFPFSWMCNLSVRGMRTWVYLPGRCPQLNPLRWNLHLVWTNRVSGYLKINLDFFNLKQPLPVSFDWIENLALTIHSETSPSVPTLCKALSKHKDEQGTILTLKRSLFTWGYGDIGHTCRCTTCKAEACHGTGPQLRSFRNWEMLRRVTFGYFGGTSDIIQSCPLTMHPHWSMLERQ